MIVKANEFMSFLRKQGASEDGEFDEIWAPVRSSESNGQGEYSYRLLNEATDPLVRLDGYRTVDPIKTFFYRFRENVLPAEYSERKRLLLGVKACDLGGLQVLDQALLHGNFVDPAYKHWRETTTIVSADCTDTAESCHCILVNGLPYSESGFDLNLVKIDDEFSIQVGSGKGQSLIDSWKGQIPLKEPTPRQNEKIEQQRQELVDQLHDQNKPYFRSDEYEFLREKAMVSWAEESRSCVGCGACTNICPTCYCLILNDESQSAAFVKMRNYDSCQLHGYARVAGGGSPRPEMTNRFRHRYLCKFSYMVSDFDRLGCTGCGRCVDACPGNIDFRQVVKRILEDTNRDRVASSPETA